MRKNDGRSILTDGEGSLENQNTRVANDKCCGIAYSLDNNTKVNLYVPVYWCENINVSESDILRYFELFSEIGFKYTFEKLELNPSFAFNIDLGWNDEDDEPEEFNEVIPFYKFSYTISLNSKERTRANKGLLVIIPRFLYCDSYEGIIQYFFEFIELGFNAFEAIQWASIKLQLLYNVPDQSYSGYYAIKSENEFSLPVTLDQFKVKSVNENSANSVNKSCTGEYPICDYEQIKSLFASGENKKAIEILTSSQITGQLESTELYRMFKEKR